MLTRIALALSLVAALAAQSRTVRADDFKIDEGHMGIVFAIGHNGLSETYGRFNKANGTYTLDADPAKCKFQLAIDAASVDTNNPGRDQHLTGPDYFSVKEFPVITFVSTKVAAKQVDGKTVYDVTGDMTMHGVKKPVTLKLTKLGEAESRGQFRSGFSCEAKLARSEFGMTKGLPGVSDDVKVLISFEGIRQ